MTTLHVQLLGEFRLLADDCPLTTVNTPRVQALLTYLVLHRGVPQARQHIAFQFWPDSTEAQARTNLRNLFHSLRRALPDAEAFLDADAKSLLWRADAPFTLDVQAFENAASRGLQLAAADDPAAIRHLQSAATRYRGDLLPSCYDEWIAPERERLRQLLITTFERLSELLTQQHDWQRAIHAAEQRLRHDPLHEETYRRLLNLHTQNADRVGVLRTYRTCAAVLASELGVEPSASTQRAYEQSLKAVARSAATPPSAALDGTVAVASHLPNPLTSFVGRARELDAVKMLLARTRLLTLTGVGGVGKTRLALAVAHDLAATFRDGVCWVELAPLSDDESVLRAVASALRVREQTERTLLESVGEALHDQHVLLVLDNCEHLIEACAQLAQRLLTVALPLRILATSREALNVLGETTWLVPPLGVPSAEFPVLSQPALDSGRSTEHSEPVALFVARAQSVMPTFHLTAQNAGIIAEICQALDGIPLAIELAAARVRTLSVADIAARLDDRFQLLRAGNRAALPRHQSLRAALDWSYDLLGDDERVLLRRLSVFHGGFTLAAAEAVCCTDEGRMTIDDHAVRPSPFLLRSSEVLDVLTHLVDKSLLVAETSEGETRFDCLETIRQYALDQLRASDEEPRVAQRHAQFFTAFAEQAAPQLIGAQQTAWLKRLRADEANLRAALDWCFAQQDTESGLRLTLALNGYWRAHSAYREGVERLRQSLALPWANTHLALRARALGALQLLLGRMGDYTTARAHAEACLHIERQLGDPQRIATALCNLASVVGAQGDEESARALQAESLAMFRQMGDAHGQAMLCTNMGESERLHGRHTNALALYAEALALYRELGNRGGIALVMHNMAQSYLAQGDTQRAARGFAESLSIYEEMNNPEGIAMCLAGFAAHATLEAKPQVAARWFGASDAIYERISARMDAVDRAAMDGYVEQLRATLDADEFKRAWDEGRALSVAEAMQSIRE